MLSPGMPNAVANAIGQRNIVECYQGRPKTTFSVYHIDASALR